ncbi:hypothetical protein [Sphingomonas sp. MMS24-J13]|uniref:hypothetical protein n=1 Tax=Sphingomonas sp. MMS24-J13 TaxID=3238686 RepID=UPI00384B1EEF
MDGIGLVAIIGGILLALALIFVVISNSRRSRQDVRRTEQGTKDLYKNVERQDQGSDPDHS